MPAMDSLRRLDNRFVRQAEDQDKASARGARYLPWMLVLACLVQFTGSLTDAVFIEGLALGLVISATVTAFTSRAVGDRG